MSGSVEQYRDQLMALQPPGLALPVDLDSNWAALLEAIAEELARVDARGDDLLDEADPRVTYELLADWERVAGLPDACAPLNDTVERRRNALLGKLTGTGGQSREYFIALAASLGFQVTIDEFDPFDVNDTVDDSIFGSDWRFAWRVNAPGNTVAYFNVGSGVNEPLADWGNDLLECAIDARKPAHTHVLFAYS